MFTVVIPAKNEAESLPRLLQSIRAQTFQPKEVIVADAFSTDATRDVAQKFGARVVDGGLPGPGRNRGASAATTEFVVFLDADVALSDPEAFEKAIGEMLERRLDVATCDVLPLSRSGRDRFMHRAYNRYVRMCGSLMPHAPGFCLFVRRRVHEAIGGFDETVTFCEDHDYARRAAKAGAFGFLNSTSIPVSVRRFDRDGRVRTSLKFVLAELHLAAIGPIRHELFRYTFGHKKFKER